MAVRLTRHLQAAEAPLALSAQLQIAVLHNEAIGSHPEDPVRFAKIAITLKHTLNRSPLKVRVIWTNPIQVPPAAAVGQNITLHPPQTADAPPPRPDRLRGSNVPSVPSSLNTAVHRSVPSQACSRPTSQTRAACHQATVAGGKNRARAPAFTAPEPRSIATISLTGSLMPSWCLAYRKASTMRPYTASYSRTAHQA